MKNEAYACAPQTKVYRPLTDLLQDLEQQVLESKRDEAGQLLADDFREFGASGRMLDREDVIRARKLDTGRSFLLSDFRATMLSPDVALATYRVAATDTTTGTSSSSLQSSVWKKLDGKWRLVFHQGSR
jgi:hypothetical protein